jgi:Skp family chaperone for outer membrane proteins
MIKKHLFTLLVLIAATNSKAQTKNGFINLAEVYYSMPEYIKADSMYYAYVKKSFNYYDEELLALLTKQQRLEKDSATLDKRILEVFKVEIVSLKRRIAFMREEIITECQREKAILFNSLEDKVMMAIEKVKSELKLSNVVSESEKNKFPNAQNILVMVKQKLGIKNGILFNSINAKWRFTF